MEQGLEKILPSYRPDYIIDEIDRYLWKRKHGNSSVSTFYNVLALIRLAVVNNRINKEQAKAIKDSIYRIKNSKLCKRLTIISNYSIICIVLAV